MLHLRHLGVELINLQLPLLLVISEDGYVLLLLQPVDLFPEFDDFALECVESHEGLQLLLVDLALDLAEQAVHVFAERLHLLAEAFDPAVDLIMHDLLELNYFLLCGIGPELELILQAVQLLLKVILLCLIGSKMLLKVQIVSEEHKFEDVLRQAG